VIAAIGGLVREANAFAAPSSIDDVIVTPLEDFDWSPST